MLDLLDDFDVTATFFVVADVLDHYPGLVKSIVERGHEIGCHGLSHACVIDPISKKTLFSAEIFEKRTLEAKRKLEQVYKKEIFGYRAPNALIGDWMFESLVKLGFRFDSSLSLNSLYRKSDVFIGYGSAPFSIEKSGGVIVEYPMAYLDLLGFKVPTSGGPILRFLGSNIVKWGLNQSLGRGHSVFYFHPIDISDEVFPKVGHGRPFYWAVKGKSVERRICSILKYFKKKEVDLTPMGSLVSEMADKYFT